MCEGRIRLEIYDEDAKAAKLSDEQREKALAWYAEKIEPTDRGCPMCGNKNFFLLDHIVAPPVTHPQTAQRLPSSGYPHYMLACTNCSTVQFINAVRVGLVQSDKPS